MTLDASQSKGPAPTSAAAVGSNVVVLVRLSGNVFAVERTANGVRVVQVGTYTQRPPDQGDALNLLRRE